ncbi:MAG: hypothetical protein ACLFTB_06335 [Desulfovibrionales bacterium]
MSKKPMEPVKPVSMELVTIYPCPHCGRRVPLMPPTQPGMGQCDACQGKFPLVPVDKRTIQFLKTITANGKSVIDPDFL